MVLLVRKTANIYDFKGIISSKFNLYYMDISEADMDEHCYLNTVKQGKALYSILDQKRAEAVRVLQEQCAFPSDELTLEGEM